jgi:enoyl-CoA hydratase/carnithine racemase
VDVLLIEDRGPVRVLTMNRPEKRNALNHALTEALRDAASAADADDAVRCLVLTGAGPAFCAGADVTEFKDLTPRESALVDRRAELTTSLHQLLPRLSKPVITAVNGPAMGGGAGLALAGDLALMAESARIGYPEVRHGIVAAIVMPNLVRQVGRKAAFELLATGDPVDARRALALGMVNRVVPDAELMTAALGLAERLAAVSRPAMAATKALFHRVAELPFEEALAAGRETNRRMRGSPR